MFKLLFKHSRTSISFKPFCSKTLDEIIIKIPPRLIENIQQKYIRNFCIIAHIDHGKSTLSDRLLEYCGALNKKLQKSEAQFLDTLKVERERGITVKAQTASMLYKYENEDYLYNLIDTPGHVDFSYEVARSLRPCQGAVLLVDATKGVQAQTIANFNQARNLVKIIINKGLDIIPIINKIDLPGASIDSTKLQLCNTLKFDENQILQISAKNGINIDLVLKTILEKVRPPSGIKESYSRTLLFDARYMETKGLILLVEVLDGTLKKGDTIISYQQDKTYDVFDIGLVQPILNSTGILNTGQVGYIITNMKDIADAKIGDTFFNHRLVKREVTPFPGFEIAKCMVYAGVYPTDPSDFDDLKKAIQKLQLNDASIKVEIETSAALGSGFRIGFLGLLHLDVFRQRLDDEYDQNILITKPSVPFKCTLKNKTQLIVENALAAPKREDILFWEEQYVLATIITPKTFYSSITSLVLECRGEEIDMEELDDDYIKLSYDLPLNEIITEFFDNLKSISQGYASMDYELADFRKSDVKHLSFLLNGSVVDALSILVHGSKAERTAREFSKKLKDNLDPCLFVIAIQAQLEKRIIVREEIKALRKNVTAKCYGGDHTRKLKLLEKQKRGKKKMRMIGEVSVDSDTFLALLKNDPK